jgi:DNA-binding MarR family transcriptional regulator
MDRPRSRNSLESSEARQQALRTLGRRLHEASAGLLLVGDRVLAPLGITSTQWKVLAALTVEGPLRVSDLVSRLRLDQAGTSRLVDRLEQAALVTRQPSQEDRRETRLLLTAEGERVAARCRAVLAPVMDELTQDFDEAQLVAFARALEAFATRIEPLAERLPKRRVARAASARKGAGGG